MLGLIVRRLLLLVPLLLLISLLTFLLLELVPGDAASRLLGEDATAEQIRQVRSELGLDRSLPARYFEFATAAAQGDLGTSLYNRQEVTTRIGRALPATLSLAGMSLLMAIAMAVPAGALAAMRPDRLFDRAVTVGSALALSVPGFIVAIFLITVFAIRNPWFPAVGYSGPSDGIAEWLRHLVLPGLSLAVLPAAELARQVRGAMRDTLETDYIVAARAKGLRTPAIVIKHAAKNAAIPVVTVFGLLINRVIGGAVIVEAVFAYPGLGTLAVNSAFSRDMPMIQGIVLVSAVTVVVANLVVDVSYGYFNPKLRR